MTRLFPRELRESEVSFFAEHGWAVLRELVAPETATELADCAAAVIAQQPAFEQYATNVDQGFRIHRRPDKTNVLARDVVLSATMGRNASRLLLGAPRVRLLQSTFLVKFGCRSGQASGPTAFHQDFPAHPLDRSEMANFWIALTAVTPEMGSLRFYSGSRRFGALGKCFLEPEDDTPNRYPALANLAISAPLELAPGDATVHHGLTVHGAPENATDSTRVAMSMTYIDAATRYTGAPFASMDGLGLHVDAPFEHPEYPLIEDVAPAGPRSPR